MEISKIVRDLTQRRSFQRQIRDAADVIAARIDLMLDGVKAQPPAA